VRVKNQAASEIDAFFRNASVTPDEINPYLVSVESAPSVQKVKLYNILLRPQVDIRGLAASLPELDRFLVPYDQEFVELAEINMKYEGYIRKEEDMVAKMSRLEDVRLQENFDYHAISALSAEARDKLSRHRPQTLGQAGRISGVSPADVSVLLIHLGR
jgi:tRNA uridine 5-carboxymethylaminomethyl modification enzyme